jgi:hypothetical protein
LARLEVGQKEDGPLHKFFRPSEKEEEKPHLDDFTHQVLKVLISPTSATAAKKIGRN